MRNFLFFSAISYNFLTIPEKDFLVGQRYGIYETEDFDKEGRDGNRKGDRCMSRDDKRIKKWRSAGTLGELYLKEMAEQGLLLEEMTPLKYIFREDEPQHLRLPYRGAGACADGRGTGGICEGWLAGGLPL